MNKNVFLYGIILFCLVGISGNVWAESGLVAYYPFDGNANDESGNGYDGTIYGASFTSGISGQALNFDGVDDYVELPYSSSFDLTSSLTLSAWIYPTGDSGNAGNWGGGIIAKGHPDYAYGLIYDTYNNNRLTLALGDYYQNGVYKRLDSPLTYGFNQWIYVVGTYDGSTMRLYVDGEEVNSDSWSLVGTNNDNLTIGTSALSYYQPRNFKGIIDEVKIYNRALSASEIQENYYSIINPTTTTTSTSSTTTSSTTTTSTTTTTTTSTTTTVPTTTTIPPTTTTTTLPTTTTTVPPTTTTTTIPIKGSIIITSNPAGADVLFDGAPVGQTPITKRNLPVGIDHSIVVSKPGYYKAERIASATTEGTQVYVELNKIPDDGRSVPHLTISQTGTQTLLKVGEETLLQYGIFNDGDADAYDVKISMEVPSGVTASFVSGASKAGGLVTWTGNKIKSGATESATVRIKSEEEGTKFIPLRVSYKDESGNKYIDDLSLSIEMVPVREAGRDRDRYPDPQDPAPLDPAKPGSGSPLNGICGPTALLGIALLPLGLLCVLRRRR